MSRYALTEEQRSLPIGAIHWSVAGTERNAKNRIVPMVQHEITLYHTHVCHSEWDDKRDRG